MKTPKYPKLRQHITLLSSQGWLTPLLESSEPRKEVLAQGQSNWHGVCEINKNARMPKLVVRVYLNAQQIIMAQLTQRQYLEACRLYDMAALFFEKYRLRGALDFNFSRQQAEKDLQNETVHREFLTAYEVGLIACGALPNADALAKKKQAIADGEKPIGSMRDQLKALVEWADAFSAGTEQHHGHMLEEQRQGFLTLRAELLGDRKQTQGILDTLSGLVRGQHEDLINLAKLEMRISNFSTQLTTIEEAFKQLVTILSQNPKKQ